MATNPLIIVIGDASLTFPHTLAVNRCADITSAMGLAEGHPLPIFVGTPETLETLPSTIKALKIIPCDTPHDALPEGIDGAWPTWEPHATTLAIATTMATHRRLLESETLAHTAEEELEAFIHTVSHDLKGPLQGIIGLSGLLMQQAGVRVFPEVATFAERIEGDADRLASMISALTAFARLGRPEVAKERVALGALIDEVCAAVKGGSTAKRPPPAAGPNPKENCRMQGGPPD